MSRIAPIRYEEASPEVKAEHDRVLKEHGVISNMKYVLLHSPTASRAVLEWYKLFDAVKPVIGQRRAILFCDAISRENACKLCASFMRRSIIKGGENPENLELDEKDRAIIDYGRQLAANANRVSDALFARLEAFLTPAQIVDLTVFGALMIVNNVFNSALQIDIDGSLDGFEVTPETAFAGSSHYDQTIDT
ncbi:MAG: carboxymuconolactone decarboxylase family protein [Chthoniobacteraceae bacterium]